MLRPLSCCTETIVLLCLLRDFHNANLGQKIRPDRKRRVFRGALKTNAYYERFLDAYGRETVEPEILRTVAALEVF